MNETSLPDDMAQWPRDPFRLLGVRPGGDKLELRRAYTRLIRRFKPEHFPDQFRRIREAYEIAQARSHWVESLREDSPAIEIIAPAPMIEPSAPPDFNRSTAPGAAPTDEASQFEDHPAPESRDEPLPADPTETPTFAGRLPSPRHGHPRDRAQRLDDLWRQACRGEIAAAYAGLVEMAESTGSPEEDLFLRLYWLLVAAPGVEPFRSAQDWLEQALRQHGFTRRLGSIYAEELRRHPAPLAILSPDDLARLPHVGQGLQTALRARWRAAGRFGAWQIIDADLRAIESRVAIESPSEWLHLLYSAVELSAWSVEPEGVTKMEHWRESLEMAALGHRERFGLLDNLDSLLSLAPMWRICQKRWPNSPITEIVQSIWIDSEQATPRLAEMVASKLSDNPTRQLARLDQIGDGRPALLAHVAKALGVACGNSSVSHDTPGGDAFLTSLVKRFTLTWQGKKYSRQRARLLEFCCRERLSPETLADRIECNFKLSKSFRTELANQLRADLSLRCVYLADVVMRG